MMRPLLLAIILIPFSSVDADSIGADAIETKIEAMSLEEKVDFIGGYEDFNIRPYPEHGIPEIHIADGPVGVRNFGPSTSYPASINLAASWDRKLAYATGAALGMEARAFNAHLVLGPGVNIYRMPITGRNFEYMGEDPYLAAQIAKEYIVGMQNQGVMANVKHYVANNQEFERHHTSSDMDERTLHEIYLPAFKTAVVDAKVATVMTGYNLVNGIQLSQHDYLNNQILKGEWAFEGFVVSDWVSTYDGIAAAKGGLDLEMPSAAQMNRDTLMPAIADGRLDESIIDDKIRRILRTYDRFGFFDQPDLSKGYKLDRTRVRKTALDSARGGMVLLKNEANVLPLSRHDLKNVAIIGPNGHPAVTGGGGSSFTQPLHSLSFNDAFARVAGIEVEFSYEQGSFTGVPFPEGMWDEFPFYVYQDGKKVQGVNAEFFKGIGLDGEVIHRRHFETLKLEDEQLWGAEAVPWTDFSVRFKSFYTPSESGYYSIAGMGDDGYRILLDDVEVVNLWRNQGPTSGKHELFLNAGQEYRVVTEFYQAGGGALIYQGIKKVEIKTPPNEFLAAAVEKAGNADLVIMPVGFGPDTEGESYDRSYDLPYQQAELIEAVAAVNDRVVVVLNAGGNVEMSPWIDQVEAVLMAWYPGQEGNLAAAEILFGETNPSGRLPASFEYALEDNPSYDHYFDTDNDKAVTYGEGIFMGYRHWDRSDKHPRFPFGFGLSYTTFSYGEAATDKQTYGRGEAVRLRIELRNSGQHAGAEVVQVYVADKQSTLPRPVKELKAFDKVTLQPGESRVVEFVLSADAFSYYNPESHTWTLEPGLFEILVGHSSADIRSRVPVTIR